MVNGDLCGAEANGKNMADRILDVSEKQSVPIVCNTVSIFVLRQQHEQVEVLLMRRTTSMPGKWCQVAGSIEAGETAWQAALRELREETGLELSQLWSGDICEQFYELQKGRIPMLPVFVGFVDALLDVQLNAKHDAFDWLDFDTVCERVAFPRQRHNLFNIEAEFLWRSIDSLLRIRIH